MEYASEGKGRRGGNLEKMVWLLICELTFIITTRYISILSLSYSLETEKTKKTITKKIIISNMLVQDGSPCPYPYLHFLLRRYPWYPYQKKLHTKPLLFSVPSPLSLTPLYSPTSNINPTVLLALHLGLTNTGSTFQGSKF